jgi:hypothetical protein
MHIQSPAPEAVAAELAELPQRSIDGLRARWRALFSANPPAAFGPDLLRRSIAQKLQENAYGGLDRPTAQLLNRLIAQSAKNNGKIAVSTRVKPGAVLVREWKGASHRVTVATDGYVYQDKPYGNLSEIARFITGSRWNGPRFFGLRTGKE